MKNYVIGIMIISIIFLGSLIYRESKILNFENFPVKTNVKEIDSEPRLFLYLFFSKRNCHDCLGIIEVLNKLPSQFKVIGIVPNIEMRNEIELRRITGATFPLEPLTKKYSTFLPNYTPTLFGAGYNGKIYFILPGVPNEKEYLEKFLTDFYVKAFQILIPTKPS